MSTIPAQSSVVELAASPPPALRLSPAVGLGLAGLMSAALWCALIAMVRHLI